MSAKTLDRAALALVQKIVAANKSGNAVTALALSQQGATAYPEFTLPGVLDGGFASLVAQFAPAAAADAEDLAAHEDREASAAVGRPVKLARPEAPKVETRTLRLVHDGVAPTSIFGVEQYSEAHRIIGAKRNGGLGWTWWGPTSAFYLRNTKGFAPDLAKIAEAVKALESATQDGVPLYRVEQEVTTKAADGTDLPVYETKAQREARAREWQITYTGRMNTAEWLRGLSRAECVSCTRTGLDVRTSRITKDGEKFPQVQCLTCVGEPEPEAAPVDMSALTLALDSKPAPTPNAQECASCRQLVEVGADGRFVLHTKPFSATACRGKVGVAPVKDVEPEAAAPKPAARKAKAAPKAAAPKAAPVVDTQDLQAELAAALAVGDNEAAARVFAAMQERANAAREAAAKAEAAKAAPSAELATLGRSWTFRTVEGISGTTLKDSATAARGDLIRALAKAGMPLAKAHTTGEGVKVEVRRNKTDMTLTAIVVDLPAEGVSAAKLAKIVRDVVSAQRGITTATAVKA